MADVYASPEPPYGQGGPTSIMAAWSGATVDTTRKRLLVWGGGHGDYSGNEVYAFDFDPESADYLEWHRLSFYSAPTNNDSDGLNSDGTPTARETASTLQYIPSLDAMLAMPGNARWMDGGADEYVFEFDAANDTPDNSAPSAWSQRENGTSYPGSVSALTNAWAMDHTTEMLYVYNYGEVRSYDPDGTPGSRYSLIIDGGAGYIDCTHSACIVPGSPPKMVLVGPANGPLTFIVDLSDGSGFETDVGSGDKAIENLNAPGLVWDASGSQVVGWAGTQTGGTDNRDWYTLNVSTGAWTRHAGTGDTPDNPETNGTYGRFAYLGHCGGEYAGLCLLVNRTTGHVYFFRASNPPTPTVTQAQFQFFSAGDELPHYEPGIVPTLDVDHVAASGNNTAETSPDVAYPAHSTGDLIIQFIASDADAAHTNPGSTGPNGETINQICWNQEPGGTNGPHLSVVWWVASANTAAGNQVWTIASEQWIGATLVIPAGKFYATTPIGSVSAVGSSSADSATADMPAFTPNRSGGLVVCVGGIDRDPMDAPYVPAGWTDIANWDIGAVSCFIATRDALSVASEQVAAASFGINTGDSYTCIGFVINGTVAVADGRTPLAVAGTDPTLDVDTDYGVSVRVENSGGPTTEDTYKWQAKLNSGSWADIGSASSVVKASATGDYAHGVDVPEYIGGSGTYITDNNAALDTGGSLTLAAVLDASQAFETHLNFKIVPGDVADGDIISLRIVEEDGTALDSYGASDTNIPAITVNKEAASVTLTVASLGQTQGVEAPSLTQKHIVAAAALLQAHTVETPALTQKHTLAAANVGQGHSLEGPALTQKQLLALADLAQSHSLEALDLTQAHILTLADLSQTQTLDPCVLTQKHTLILADIGQSHSLANVNLGAALLLEIQGITQSQALETALLTQKHLLALADLGQAQSVQEILLAQKHLLAVAGLDQVQAMEAVLLAQKHGLGVADLAQGQALATLLLTQKHLLASASLTQDQSIAAALVTQKHLLALANLGQTQTLDPVVLGTAGLLIVANLLQGQSLGPVDLAQKHTLEPANLAQGHALQNVSLTQALELIVADLLQAHSLEAVAIGQTHLLTVDALGQTHDLGSVDLAQKHGLTIADLLQAHGLANVTLRLPIEGARLTFDARSKTWILSAKPKTWTLTAKHAMTRSA